MSKQVHFVIAVDLDTKDWWVNDVVFSQRFWSDEGTWDTETNGWEATTWEDNINALDILKGNKED